METIKKAIASGKGKADVDMEVAETCKLIPFKDHHRNTHHEGGQEGNGSDEEEDGHHHGGAQRVQCAN